MENLTLQNVWKQLEDRLVCGDCKAARLLIWEKKKYADYDDGPQHGILLDERWWCAVHCDYFRRRVEYPGRLRRCGAHQKKDNG